MSSGNPMCLHSAKPGECAFTTCRNFGEPWNHTLSVPREDVVRFILSLDTALPDTPWPEAQTGDIVDALAARYGWNITPRFCGAVSTAGLVCGSPDAHEREDTHYTFSGGMTIAWRY